MNPTQILKWITSLYGEPQLQHANGVFVAAVPLLAGGVAIGCGSCATNAIGDLYCELNLPTARGPLNGFRFQPWEKERRERIDASR